MWLVVGLGNPGPRYEKNRHNIGFQVIDLLAKRHHSGKFRSKFGGDVSTAVIGGNKLAFLKPMEFMNRSGYAVSKHVQFLNISENFVLVIHDEIDLPLGRIKLKSGGGAGGHNGLRSITDQLGTSAFHRIRVGIGKPEKQQGDNKVIPHVLSNFPAHELDEVQKLINLASDATETIICDGMLAAMNLYNARPKSVHETI